MFAQLDKDQRYKQVFGMTLASLLLLFTVVINVLIFLDLSIAFYR